jgi:hypothetical protein
VLEIGLGLIQTWQGCSIGKLNPKRPPAEAFWRIPRLRASNIGGSVPILCAGVCRLRVTHFLLLHRTRLPVF